MLFADDYENMRANQMESFKIENLTFTYPDMHKKAVDDISLVIKKGEFVTLCGESGCGKTTFLRFLKPSIAPHGKKTGKIFFDIKLFVFSKNLGASHKHNSQIITTVETNPPRDSI